MLKFTDIMGALCRAMIACVSLALLANCSVGSVDEERFSLYLNNKSYNELVRALQYYSAVHGYHVTVETLQGNRPETTRQQIMVEGNGMRALVQSALAEKCQGREGRRDVEFSQRVFDANVFSTSYFNSNEELSRQVEQLQGALTASGFRLVSRSESCELL